MLLGLEYRKPIRTYQRRTAGGTWWKMGGALDADTLRVMERGEVKQREELSRFIDNRYRIEDTNYED